MKVGRCLTRNYFIGCSADVTDMMHARCSGRRHCSVAIPDATMFAAQPCPGDLVAYLEAEYECLKVTKSDPESCLEGGMQVLTSNSGYIFKPPVKSEDSKPPCRQHIVAQPGQTINVYMNDYHQGDDAALRSAAPGDCDTYGYVFEDSTTIATRICGGAFKKNQLIYNSKGNTVDITLTKGSAHSHHYLLEYEIVGCPTIVPPTNAWVSIQADTAVVTCNDSNIATKLYCAGNTWVGDIQNCTHVNADFLIAESILVSSFSDLFASSGVFIVVCIGLAFSVLSAIGLLVLVLNFVRARRVKAEMVADLYERQAAPKAEHPEEKPAKDAEQYQPVYLPITVDPLGKYMPVSAFATAAANLPGCKDYASTLEARIHAAENTYAPMDTTMCSLAALNHTLGRDRVITIEEDN